jgi:DNA-3-methyladenine glycosylase
VNSREIIGFLGQPAPIVAKQLIGWQFYAKEPDGSLVGGTINETEAYTQVDAASHSYNGQTVRNEIMFGPAGRLYVYFTYGMHWCANIVTGESGRGEAVLLRSIKPTSGLATIKYRRNNRPESELTNGPAKLCQALAITKSDNGSAINKGRFVLLPPERTFKAVATSRIGITRDTHRLWRFVEDLG